MDDRLGRDDLNRLLELAESGQPFSRDDADAGRVLKPASGTVLESFAQYFDRGLLQASSMAAALSQSQTYGHCTEVTDVLRKWTTGADGVPNKSAYLLAGEDEVGGLPGLPTLDDVRANYRVMTGGRELTDTELLDYAGKGEPLVGNILLAPDEDGPALSNDSGRQIMAGDGATGSASGLAIGIIWHGNHNYWVDRLREDTGGTWSEDQYFTAARLINAAEYQRVVFTEFAEALTEGAGVGGGIVTMPGAPAPDVGQFSETFSYVDPLGLAREVSLAGAILGAPAPEGRADGSLPSPDRAASPGALKQGAFASAMDLVHLEATRGRDGTATFNQLRAELFVLTGLASLRPYESWGDFQTRNHLPAGVIEDLKAAYPEGVDAMDAWVGSLAEAPSAGQLGATLAHVREQLDETLPSGDDVANLGALTGSSGLGGVTFAAIVRRLRPDSDIPDAVLQADAAVLGNGGEVVFGSAGDDLILGGDGDDVIGAGLGSDVVFGGRGDDIIRGDGSLPALAADDDDAPESDATGELVSEGSGGSGNIAIDSSSAQGSGAGNSDAGKADVPDSISDDDVIWGGEGNDTIYGEQGSDRLSGDAGDDTLHGGRGNDVISGGEGDDYAAGGSGDDVLAGGSGNDVLSGGYGNDTASGGSGADSIKGGEGNDWLYGDDQQEEDSSGQADPAGVTVAGTSRSDTIIGSHGADDLAGGSGSDLILGGAGVDQIDGGDSSDTLDGGAGDDWVDGGRGNDFLSGGAGNDVLIGGLGSDELEGGVGNDRLEGGSGSNRMAGGAGDDWIVSISGSDTIVLQPGFGNDTVVGFAIGGTGSGSGSRIDVSAYGFTEDDLGSLIQILAQGSDTVVTIGTDTLTLLSVDPQSLDRGDFIF